MLVIVTGVTVKFTGLLGEPPTVTTKGPVVAPLGTVTVSPVSIKAVTYVGVPLNVIVSTPEVPKFDPEIDKDAPTGPNGGLTFEMVGVTVKAALLNPPLVWSTIFPVVAPDGTGTTTLVLLQLVGVATALFPTVPTNVTVLVPCVAPKLVPVIITDVATRPATGLRLVISGGGITVKGKPLLTRPPTVTMTLPEVAPGGTGTVILVALQAVGDAVVPLNVTVLAPCVAPKLAPVIVTEVPTGPEVGFKLVMLGGRLPALAALKAAKAAHQISEAPREALAEAAPAVDCIWLSVMSFVFGAAGTRSSSTKPLPAVSVAPFAVTATPSSKSPFTVVVVAPLLGNALVPWAPTATSSELAVATPEYSRMANRRVFEVMLSETVTVFAPPAIFSA
jgi:hypothetical protein